MTYAVIATIAMDQQLWQRVTACAATQAQLQNASQWVSSHQWSLAAAPGWADAYASAQATNVPDPGWSDTVITDEMILSAVQNMGGLS